MILRDARLTDAAEIAALTAELGYEAGEDAVRHRLEGLRPRERELVTVAIWGDRIAGWIQVHAATVLAFGFRAEVLGLVVGQGFRRRGIGRALIEHAEQWAAGIGAAAVVIRSNTKRVESNLFYPALGYSLSKTQVVYRKDLNKANSRGWEKFGSAGGKTAST